jgi:hypothetical protein
VPALHDQQQLSLAEAVDLLVGPPDVRHDRQTGRRLIQQHR